MNLYIPGFFQKYSMLSIFKNIIIYYNWLLVVKDRASCLQTPSLGACNNSKKGENSNSDKSVSFSQAVVLHQSTCRCVGSGSDARKRGKLLSHSQDTPFLVCSQKDNDSATVVGDFYCWWVWSISSSFLNYILVVLTASAITFFSSFNCYCAANVSVRAILLWTILIKMCNFFNNMLRNRKGWMPPVLPHKHFFFSSRFLSFMLVQPASS